MGHSDGDPVLHSITDAILGACKMGDIGQMFSDKNKKFKNIRSTILLQKVVKDYFFHTFSGVGLGSRDYIIGLNSDLKYYMFDYGYAVYSKKATYRYYKTIFIMRYTKNDLPRFRLKPKGLFDVFFGKNRKNELPKHYVDYLNGYYFWYDKKANSIEDVVKLLPEEIFIMVKDYKGMIIEHFSGHLVINYNNCRIPSYNLSRFFDIGLSMKNSLSG